MSAWIDLKEPRSRSYEDLLAYFGVEPPPDQVVLGEHIGRKRRKWRTYESGPNKKGRPQATRVLERIQQIAEALQRNVPLPDADAIPDDEELSATLVPLEELWEHIDGLLRQGDLDGALHVARRARSAYRGSWQPPAAYGYVIHVGVEAQQIAQPALIADGLESLREASRLEPRQRIIWESAGSLLDRLGRDDELLLLTTRAEQSLGAIPPSLIGRRAKVLLRQGNLFEGLKDAVRSFSAAPGDLALRGVVTEAIVRHALSPMLPLSSTGQLQQYVKAVEVAAWCAQGVPEAEDLVRPHRLWAAKAGTQLFSGSDGLRTLLAVCTLFVSLWPHNKLSGKPAWKILYNGPDEGWRFQQVLGSAAVRQVHHGRMAQFPWSATVGASG